MPALSENEIYRGLFKSALRRYFYNNKEIRSTYAYMTDEDYNKFISYNEDMGAGTPEGAKQLNQYNKIVFGAAFTAFYNRVVGNMMSPDGKPYKDENQLAKDFVEGKPVVFLGTANDQLVCLSGDKDKLWSQFLNINSTMSTRASLPYVQSNDNVLATSWNINDMKGQKEYDRERDSVKPDGGGWWNNICKFFTGKPSKRWENYERHLAREKTEAQIKLMHLPKDGSGLKDARYELSDENMRKQKEYAEEQWEKKVTESARSERVPKGEKLQDYRNIKKNTDFLRGKKEKVNNELSLNDEKLEIKDVSTQNTVNTANTTNNVNTANTNNIINNIVNNNNTLNNNQSRNNIPDEDDDEYDDPDEEIVIHGLKKIPASEQNNSIQNEQPANTNIDSGNKIPENKEETVEKKNIINLEDEDEFVPKKSQKQLEQEKLLADKQRRINVYNENNNNLLLLKRGGKITVNNKQQTVFADNRLMTMPSCNNASGLLNIRKVVESTDPINPEEFGKSLAENMSRIYLGQTLFDNKDSMSQHQYDNFSQDEYEFNELNEYEQWVRASNGGYKKDNDLSKRLTEQIKESAIYKTIMSSVEKNNFKKAREDMDKIFFDEDVPFNQKMNSVLKEQGIYDKFIQNVKGPNYNPVEPQITEDKNLDDKTSNLLF